MIGGNGGRSGRADLSLDQALFDLPAEVASKFCAMLFPSAALVGELDVEREGALGGDRGGRRAEWAVGQSHATDRTVEVLQVNHDSGDGVPPWRITDETRGFARRRDGQLH